MLYQVLSLFNLNKNQHKQAIAQFVSCLKVSVALSTTRPIAQAAAFLVSDRMALISLQEFQSSLTVNGYKQAPVGYYETIVKEAERKAGISTRLELAMFLAQIYHESAGLVYRKEINPLPDYGFYYGRGFIQLVSNRVC